MCQHKRENMKIVLITPCYYPNLSGGSERSLKMLAEGFVKKGLKVSVLSFDGIERKKIERLNEVKVIRVKKLNLKPNTFYLNVSLLLNKNIVKKERPDIIHVYNTWHMPGSFFLRKYSPVVATLNNCFPICPLSHTLNNIVEKDKITFFSMFREIFISFEGNLLVRFLAAIGYSVYDLIISLFSKKLDAYIAYSKAIKKIYITKGFSEDKIQVISNIFEQKERKKENIKRKKNVVLYVGGLSKAKGVFDLIESFKLIKNKKIQLRMIGDGVLKTELQNIVKKYNLNVKFSGKLELDEIKKHYRESSVLVHPSLCTEAFSRVWIEALEENIPIISSDNPVAKEELKDGVVFYRRGHPEELANRIEDVVKGKIKMNTAKTKERIFSQNPLEKMILLYKKIIKNKT